MYNSFSKHYYSPTYHWCYWSGLCLWWLRWFNGGQLVQDSHSSFAWRALMTIGYWKDWLFQACPQTESNSCRCQLGSLLRGKLTNHKPSFLTKIEWMTFDGLKTLVDLVYEYLICVYYASSSQNIGEVPIHFSYFFNIYYFFGGKEARTGRWNHRVSSLSGTHWGRVRERWCQKWPRWYSLRR